MAATIVATVGATNANSYLTQAAADALADERLQVTNWTAASADEKARALISATRRIDQLQFEGSKVTDAQALKWPRVDAFDDNEDEYSSTAIPDIVEQATFEVGLWLLNQDAASTDPLAPTGLEGFDYARVGPLEVRPNHGQRSGALPDSIKRLLRPVLLSSGIMAELERS